jgi:signal transduction histidine kinase
LERGDEHSYIDISMAVIDPRNTNLTAIITMHDLTPSRELEMMKLDFVTIAAHELRTPLTVVRGYLNLINTDALAQLSILNIENLQRALIGAEQLSGIINNLLNVSRIERGDFHVVMTKANIVDIAKQVVAQQQVTAKLKDQKLTFADPGGDIFVYADVSALSEVINNLVSNAMKYTQANGSIVLKVSKGNDHMRLEVVDDGPGIPDNAQKHLFTKFYRVEHTLTAGNRGTGLGLFIAKTIILTHKGKIGVVSKIGVGSNFYFSLPLYDPKLIDHNVDNDKELIGNHGWITKRSRR